MALKLLNQIPQPTAKDIYVKLDELDALKRPRWNLGQIFTKFCPYKYS